MNKKKFLIISVIALFLLGALLVKKDEKIVKKYFEKVSVENQEKKLKKEIGRKIYINEFNSTISKLDLNGLNTVNYLTDRETIKNSLNDKESVNLMQRISSPDISVEQAESILLTSRELTELQNVSVELKAFLKKKYKEFDYEYFGKNGDKIIAYIRDRENVYSLLPEKLLTVVKSGSILQAEKLKELLKDEKLPEVVDATTEDFFSLKLDYKKMNELYELSQKLSKIVEVIPETKICIKELYPTLDYALILKDGVYFLDDKRSQDEIDMEYSKGEYLFKNPYVKINPFKRVQNSILVKYPGIEKENLKVTIKGRGASKDLEYKIIKQSQLEIYGLFIGNEANIITINNGKEEISLPITIDKLPSFMPVIIVDKESQYTTEKSSENDMFYTTYVNKTDSYGIIFDRAGKIRYLFNPNLENSTSVRYLKFEKNGFIYFDKEDVMLFSKIGKVVSRMSLTEFDSKEENEETLTFSKFGYPESTNKNIFEKNITVITKSFISEDYPKGVISALNVNTNETIFTAELYFDNNDKNENSINSSEEIEFPN